MNDTLEFRLTVRRFAGLRALLIADDGSAIETIAARLPAGTLAGCAVRVPAENGRYDWTRAVLEGTTGRTVEA